MKPHQDRAKAVGDIPAGLFIVCSESVGRDRIDGFLASWIQQASFSPLRITLCVKKGRPAYESIMAGNIFTINVIGEHDKNFLKHFWKGYDPANNPFDKDVPFKRLGNQAILITLAKSVMECKMVEKINVGDHELVVADVLNSYEVDDKSKPLVHFRKSGKSY